MTSTLITDTITAELQALSQDEKRKVLPRFFKQARENMVKATLSWAL